MNAFDALLGEDETAATVLANQRLERKKQKKEKKEAKKAKEKDPEAWQNVDPQSLKIIASRRSQWRITSNKRVRVLETPGVQARGTGAYLESGEVFSIVEVREDSEGRTFLKIEDGDGWA